jgi:hypothetical protein
LLWVLWGDATLSLIKEDRFIERCYCNATCKSKVRCLSSSVELPR